MWRGKDGGSIGAEAIRFLFTITLLVDHCPFLIDVTAVRRRNHVRDPVNFTLHCLDPENSLVLRIVRESHKK